jgi:hypothetical protein
VHWGNVDAETAKSAAALLEKGKRIEMKRFPFDNITIDEELEAVRKDAEQVGQAHPPTLQRPDHHAGYERQSSRHEHILGE